MQGANRLRAGRVGEVFEIASPTLPRWATYTEKRNPKFKIHKTQGQAFNALSNQMPRNECLVLEYSVARMQWLIYIDYKPPVNCERCGDPFEKSNGHKDMLLDANGGPNYLANIICRVCWVADYIEQYEHYPEYLPMIGSYHESFQRLMEISPRHKQMWNNMVDAHHEFKKQRGRIF